MTSSQSPVIFTQDMYSTLKDKIHASQSIAIFGHENIDGDALGSILWFGSLLEKLGKQISYFTSLPPVSAYSFMQGIEKVQTTIDYSQNYDLMIFCDFTPYDRIQWLTKWHEEYFDAHYKIVIDHHLDSKIRWDLELKDTNSSSCCGLLYEICSYIWPELIDENIATHWYTWLTTDTGNFMYGKSPKRDFHIASALLDHNANKDYVVKNIFYSNPPSLIDMAKIIFTRATIQENIMYTWYTQEELASNNLSDDDVEIVQVALKSVSGIPIYLRLRYMWEYRSGSMRSWWTKTWERISVQQIAITFPKWWGHMYASWFSTPVDSTLSIEEDVKRIIDYINKEAQKQL